jgi:hypothetical protein
MRQSFDSGSFLRKWVWHLEIISVLATINSEYKHKRSAEENGKNYSKP